MRSIINFFIRREACRNAATAIQGHPWDGEIGHHAWSLTVFFEEYMHSGAEGTAEDFGPKDAVELKVVKKGEVTCRA